MALAISYGDFELRYVIKLHVLYSTDSTFQFLKNSRSAEIAHFKGNVPNILHIWSLLFQRRIIFVMQITMALSSIIVNNGLDQEQFSSF